MVRWSTKPNSSPASATRRFRTTPTRPSTASSDSHVTPSRTLADPQGFLRGGYSHLRRRVRPRRRAHLESITTRQLITRLKNTLKPPIEYAGLKHAVTVSIGAATAQSGDTINRALARADQYLYANRRKYHAQRAQTRRTIHPKQT